MHGGRDGRAPLQGSLAGVRLGSPRRCSGRRAREHVEPDRCRERSTARAARRGRTTAASADANGPSRWRQHRRLHRGRRTDTAPSPTPSGFLPTRSLARAHNRADRRSSRSMRVDSRRARHEPGRVAGRLRRPRAYVVHQPCRNQSVSYRRGTSGDAPTRPGPKARDSRRLNPGTSFPRFAICGTSPPWCQSDYADRAGIT